MNSSEALIHHFYTCFKNKDVKGMQDCYADNATFSDPVFINLNAVEVRNMWQMLIGSSNDMHITYHHVQISENTGTAEWTAWYTFSATGKKVKNRIRASFVFSNGKIVQHRDHFNFYNWARQALGLTGILIGWTALLKDKVRRQAASKLEKYMNAQSFS